MSRQGRQLTTGLLAIAVALGCCAVASADSDCGESAAFEIDNAVTVLYVTADSLAGLYGLGETITLEVHFSEHVTVDTTAGLPVLRLATGSANAQAAFVDPGTTVPTTRLDFEYTVVSGDSTDDLSYTDADALQLNGAVIESPAGIVADTTLPVVGEEGSLSYNCDIRLIREIFDDFSYTSAGSQALSCFGWRVREQPGKPGPANCDPNDILWDAGLVDIRGGQLELSAETTGTCGQIWQSEVSFVYPLLEGTWAARLTFSDEHVGTPYASVQAFFGISDVEATECTEAYSECDFEYLWDNVWMLSCLHEPTLHMTTYDESCEGTTLKLTERDCSVGYGTARLYSMRIGNDEVAYEVAGQAYGPHGGDYYPESAMSPHFQHWFTEISPGSLATATMTVDWFYYADDPTLTQGEIATRVAIMRSQGVDRRDTMTGRADADGNGVPDACVLGGDLDGDGDVDFGDFVQMNYCVAGPGLPSGDECDSADINSDGAVDLADYAAFQLIFGQ